MNLVRRNKGHHCCYVEVSSSHEQQWNMTHLMVIAEQVNCELLDVLDLAYLSCLLVQEQLDQLSYCFCWYYDEYC